MNFLELLKRVQRHETVTPSELSEVIRLLESGAASDTYTLLEILGRAGSSKHRNLMERYLHNVGDSQISALALMALCGWWGLLGAYRTEIISFLNGVEWDTGDYIKLQATSIAGEYLRINADREILQTIYMIFSDDTERLLIRSAAYIALCRSEGIEWRDMPPASRVVDFSRQINHDVISRVEEKLRPVNPAGAQEETEMPSNLKYRIVLSVKHPTVNPSVITSKLGLEPVMGWASGAERKTPAGALLPGVSKTSAWGYSFDVDGSRLFSEGVSKMLSVLLRSAEFINELVQSGATIGLYIYLPGSVNIGDVIPRKTLEQLASLGVDLGVEVFPNF